MTDTRTHNSVNELTARTNPSTSLTYDIAAPVVAARGCKQRHSIIGFSSSFLDYGCATLVCSGILRRRAKGAPCVAQAPSPVVVCRYPVCSYRLKDQALAERACGPKGKTVL